MVYQPHAQFHPKLGGTGREISRTILPTRDRCVSSLFGQNGSSLGRVTDGISYEVKVGQKLVDVIKVKHSNKTLLLSIVVSMQVGIVLDRGLGGIANRL